MFYDSVVVRICRMDHRTVLITSARLQDTTLRLGHGDSDVSKDTLWIEPPMLFVLGLYIATSWVWKHSRHLNPERFLGIFVPLFLLSVYPIIAVASGWMIPWAMTYMTIYPIMPILAGMTLMMSVFNSRVGTRG